eukprot:1372886-Rhodomonas_salina.2
MKPISGNRGENGRGNEEEEQVREINKLLLLQNPAFHTEKGRAACEIALMGHPCKSSSVDGCERRASAQVRPAVRAKSRRRLISFSSSFFDMAPCSQSNNRSGWQLGVDT